MGGETDDTIDRLKSLGLDTAQARLYVSTLKFGPASVKDLAARSGMHVATTYRKMKELLQLDLVEERLGSPNLYTARDPSEALGRLLERAEANLKLKCYQANEAETSLLEMAGRKPAGAEGASSPKVSYRLVMGRDALYRISRRMKEEATKEILLIVPAKGIRRLVREGYLDEIINGVRRGVAIRMVTEITDANMLEGTELADLIELRHYPRISFRLGIYDRAKCHIGAAYDDDPSSDGSNDIYLIIEDAALAKSMVPLFEGIWEKSVPAASVLKRLKAARPSARTY